MSSPGPARGWQGTWVPPSLPLSRTVCTSAPSNPGSAHASRGSAAPKSQPPARSTCLWQSALLRCAPRFCDARGAPPGPVGLQDTPEGRAASAEARVPPPAAACPGSAGPQPRRPQGRWRERGKHGLESWAGGTARDTTPFKAKPNTWTGISVKWNFYSQPPECWQQTAPEEPVSSGVWAWSWRLPHCLGQKLPVTADLPGGLWEPGLFLRGMGGGAGREPFFTICLFLPRKWCLFLCGQESRDGRGKGGCCWVDAIDKKRPPKAWFRADFFLRNVWFILGRIWEDKYNAGWLSLNSVLLPPASLKPHVVTPCGQGHPLHSERELPVYPHLLRVGKPTYWFFLSHFLLSSPLGRVKLSYTFLD